MAPKARAHHQGGSVDRAAQGFWFLRLCQSVPLGAMSLPDGRPATMPGLCAKVIRDRLFAIWVEDDCIFINEASA